ncbi:MAG: hypothetical protein IJV13_06370, partial [Prevotella sp.]|nr:hypothetical protein [Prevotella sp.]
MDTIIRQIFTTFADESAMMLTFGKGEHALFALAYSHHCTRFVQATDMKHWIGIYIIMVGACLMILAGCTGGGTSGKRVPQ